MKYAVVTGGAGFIGSHLVDRLTDEGMHVVAIDNLSTGRVANLQRAIERGAATFVFADVATTGAELLQLVSESGADKIDEVYHLASPESPRFYGFHPWETLAANSLGTLATIELALTHSAAYVFASTPEIFGDHLMQPQSPYVEGKRFAEAAVSVAVRTRSLRGAIARIFNCYGPRMELRDGRLVSALLEATAEKQPFPIFGNGHQTRCLTYVDDVVAGLMVLARSEPQELQPVNLGTEDERTVDEIARSFASVAEVPYAPQFLPPRPHDPMRLRPSIDRARAAGWEPRTSLEQGLRKTYRWYLHEAVAYV